MNTGAGELGLFVGRFHPVLVHLPIGVIVIVFLLEILGRWPRLKYVTSANGVILGLTVPATAGSALCGWLLSQSGGYDEHLLNWHKWTGIGVAACCVVAFFLRYLNYQKSYLICITITFASLPVASHYGGSLTHGSDYLTRYAPEPLRGLMGARQTKAPPSNSEGGDNQFVTEVLPVLNKTCVSCHGPEKAKGGLRVDTLAAIRNGGTNGPVVVPGKAEASSLIQRMLLPLEDDDRMPPKGKPQPSSAEIALLQRWVEDGAPAEFPATNTILQAQPRVARVTTKTPYDR